MQKYSQAELKIVAEQLAAKVRAARDDVEFFDEPFKHPVIDDALSPEMAEACLASFPDLKDPLWEHAHDEASR